MTLHRMLQSMRVSLDGKHSSRNACRMTELYEDALSLEAMHVGSMVGAYPRRAETRSVNVPYLAE